jgi:ADP-ribosylglycohydrolase
MLASATGDSLGASVEFLTWTEIQTIHGESGVRDLTHAFGMPTGVITDDTQQAIAVGAGLMAAIPQGLTNENIRACVWRELKQWRVMQDANPQHRRAPGQTSMVALNGEMMGTLECPLNGSNSGGSVMRVHPVGILFAYDLNLANCMGIQLSVLTHGGVQAIHASAIQASLISLLCSGVSLTNAFTLLLKHFPTSFGVLPATTLAMSISICVRETNWLGWTADEALAMAILAARRHENDLKEGLLEAVNHDGDSDTVGVIAGAILGACLGLEALPRDWSERLERRGELISIARTLANVEQ